MGACATASALGLAYIARDVVDADIGAGALHTVLDSWMPAMDDVFLYYPRSGGRQPKLRAWIDLVQELVGSEPLGPDRRARRSEDED